MMGKTASRCDSWNTPSVKSGGYEVPSCVRTMLRAGGVAPSIIDFDTICRQVVSCTQWLIQCCRKSILYSFDTGRRPVGGVEVQLYSFMTTAVEGGEGPASRPGRSLPPGKTRYPLYRRLCGSQGWLGQVRKISPPHRDSIPGPSSPQPVAII